MNNKNEEVGNLTEKALDKTIMEIKDQVVTKSEMPEWWKMLDKKDRFQIGDVVLLDQENKYAVFCGPAKREGLVKLNVIKKQISKGFYNRNWYVSIGEIELVKRKNKLSNSFICANDKIYKITK